MREIYVLLIVILIGNCKIHGQEQLINGQVKLLQCSNKEGAEEYRCFYRIVGEFLALNLGKKQIKQLTTLRPDGKRDTLKLSFNFLVGKQGRIVKESFECDFEDSDSLQYFVSENLYNHFLFNSPRNNCGRPIPYFGYWANLFFVPDTDEEESVKLVPYSVIEYDQNKEKNNETVDVIERIPVYKGCKKYIKKGNEVLKSCMSKNVSKFVVSHFNTNVASHLGLSGCATHILAFFTITKEGEVANIKVYAEHAELEEEAARIIKKLPKITPGTQEGEAVSVFYRLPIILKM